MKRIEIAALAACCGLLGGLSVAHAARHQIIGAQLNGRGGQPTARIVPGKDGRPLVQDLGTARYLQTSTVNLNLARRTKAQGTFPAHGGALCGTYDCQRVDLRHGRQAVVISAADRSTLGEAARGTERAMVVVGQENVGLFGEGYLLAPPLAQRVQRGYTVVGLKLRDPTKAGRVLVAPVGHSGIAEMSRARVIELAPRDRR